MVIVVTMLQSLKMSYTVRSVGGNLKLKRVTSGLDAREQVVGGGGITHA